MKTNCCCCCWLAKVSLFFPSLMLFSFFYKRLTGAPGLSSRKPRAAALTHPTQYRGITSLSLPRHCYSGPSNTQKMQPSSNNNNNNGERATYFYEPIFDNDRSVKFNSIYPPSYNLRLFRMCTRLTLEADECVQYQTAARTDNAAAGGQQFTYGSEETDRGAVIGCIF